MLSKCKNIQLDALDNFGNSSLHLAWEEGLLSDCKLLIRSGASVSLQNKVRRFSRYISVNSRYFHFLFQEEKTPLDFIVDYSFAKELKNFLQRGEDMSDVE